MGPMEARLPSRDLVLIGAGHTNLHIVRKWPSAPIPDVRVTLVSPFPLATYSGMLPGVLAGLYPPEAMQIDLRRLASSCGVRLIVAAAIGLDRRRGKVLVDGRPPLPYDAAVIGLGSVPMQAPSSGPGVLVVNIKPMATFLERLEAALLAVGDANLRSSRTVSAVVVGGGAGGVEIALALAARLKQRSPPVALKLLDGGNEILAGYSNGLRDRAMRTLAKRQIDVVLGRRAVDIGAGGLQLADGATIPADLVIWAAGAAPNPVLAAFDVPRTDDGFVAVRPTLQSLNDDAVFAVGDAATIVGRETPKAGVYAVRQGPILWSNLRRFFEQAPLRQYRPQSGFLSLLSTGDGRAIGQYKGLVFEGPWAWRWKDHIDRKFMRMHQNYAPMKPVQQRTGGDISPAPTPPRCRGCGGKVAASVLEEALARLRRESGKAGADAIDTPGAPQDAAVLGPPLQGADVLTVDFFEAFLDDPYLTGRIGALHAMSDIWATGADPLGAMAMVAVPPGDEAAQTELLTQTLAGAVRELRAAGVSLLGGHTIESDSFLIGFNIVGRLGGKSPFRKSGLSPGQALILTKPLGTGVLLAAHMQSQCRAEWLEECLAQMLVSNAAAAGIARGHGAAAVTDVTGFGLAGHLLEMIRQENVAAVLRLHDIPLLDGFAELSAQGVASSLDKANRRTASQIASPSATGQERVVYNSLFDPQTSGGLLIAVAAHRAEALRAELHAAGYSRASVIGDVTPPGDFAIRCVS